MHSDANEQARAIATAREMDRDEATDPIEIIAEGLRPDFGDFGYSSRLRIAAIALSALRDAGLCVVPITVSDLMADAAERTGLFEGAPQRTVFDQIDGVWRVMIAASQETQG